MATIRKHTARWTTKDGEKRAKVRWRAVYTDRAGEEHVKHFDRKAEGQIWIDEQTASMVRGDWVDPELGKQTFKSYAEAWRARQIHAESTKETFEIVLNSHLYPAVGGWAIDSIRQADIQELVAKWASTAAATTVHLRYGVLAIVLNSAVRERVIARSPCEGTKLPKLDPKSALVPITTDVVKNLSETIYPRYKNLVIVAAATGMRRGEILGLTLDRVSRDFNTIRVDRQLRTTEPTWKPPKTPSSVRTMAVPDVVLEAIENQKETYGVHPSGLIFTNSSGNPIGKSTLWMAWRTAATKIGTDATPHDLRHYFASMHIRSGTSIKALQALLGHKKASETWDTYGHLIGDEDERTRLVLQSALGAGPDSNRTVAPRVK
ncbi:tyrosine-type recombinase/integrase [Nocardioides sp. NPDC101246]|uniref:tyrosine-type recombinase/integrase n=1 Tax=Nocardioides sp. NPDC101246 TaxID=3364336 RepID=UPI0038306C3F